MSSFDKVVKLACKPKAAPPKAKYLDPIIAATWSDDGAVHDVCKALSPRFREPNHIVVFKALIVLHTMIRNGATDNVLSYLSQSDVLKLRNVSSGNWEGYAAPENLQNYSVYLDSRIRAYRDLKHDAVRVQAESNRDMRNSISIEEDGYKSRKDQGGKPASTGPTRSKTIMGRKLRVMTVEKGLLRETKAVHRMIDALVECRFYLDDLEDELTITALRMLVKDLLILFQAGNEGVINVLEHYFEMSQVDAQEALVIYRHFCKQTERVVEFLGVAKKLQNLLNVPIPNLKHAPVSLAGALQEYLEDPNFEQNRIEYKANKDAAERVTKKSADPKSKKSESSGSKPTTSASTSTATQGASNGSTSTGLKENKDIIDFFTAIEEEQPSMFNPQTNSPSSAYFQQQAANPFAQMTTSQPFAVQVAPQQTGFLMPQQTAFQAPNPFNLIAQQQQQMQPQPTGHRPFSSFIQPQQTAFQQQPQQSFQQPQQTGIQQQQPQQGFQQQPQQNSFLRPQPTGFLQPQATGSNPFRQSMLMPQSTGMALFGGMGPQGGSSPFPGQNQPQQSQGSFGLQGQNPSGPMTAPGASFSSQPASPFAQMPSNTPTNVPARPASTPLTAFGPSSASGASPPMAQPVKTHQTGTKNPFGPIATAPPPVPKPPTLMELSLGGANNGWQAGQQQQQQQQQQQPQATGSFGNGFGFSSSALSPGATDISSIASSFATGNKTNTTSNDNQQSGTSGFSLSGPLGSQNTTTTTTTGSTFSDSLFSSSPLSTQPTGFTNTPSSPSIAVSPPLKPQFTGFSGLKAFKPSSSFGTSLLESLPPIPGSTPTTPAINGSTPAGGANPSSGFSSTFNSQNTGFGALNSQSTGATGGFGGGSTLGQGLRPQMTGGGGANPFRASMMGISTPPPMPSFNGNTTPSSMPGFMGGMSSQSFATNVGGPKFGSNPNPNHGGQQQGSSLI
ncbi:ANTH domain-containing protein [Crucibulum laeve]|uniref:ANTH domain-containing protein n=1 Tax=Crucibulum laeve TaxID=68775 RepID=A0A5C3M5K5_9AGAR|nr:ANTH domain-containing protein [Crucibulum laeve]